MDELKPKKKIESWMWGVPVLIVLTLIFYFTQQMRPGILGVVIYYAAPPLVGFFSIIFFVWGLIRSLTRRPFFTRWRLLGFASLILLCFTNLIYGTYPSSFDDKPSKVSFRLPLDETITVFWGGAEEKNNYHALYPDQRWAYDLVVTKEDRTFKGDSLKLESYYIYGLPVLAPADGKVVAVFDRDPDMQIGELGGGTDAGGNQIVLQVAPGEFLFICHLQPKSIKVKAGDSVLQGQPVALVGNSGNTSQPHIHLHLQSTKELGLGEGIPLPFSHYLLGNKFVERGIPLGGFNDGGEFIGQVVKHVK